MSKTFLCPLEEIIFWNWADFSKPIPNQIIKYFFYRIKDSANVTESVRAWNPHKENFHVIGTILWEYLPEEFENKINQIVDILSNNNIKFTILLNADYKHKFNHIPNTVFINYFLLRTYWYTLKNKNQHINQNWCDSSNKGLFLTGKTNKLHRVGLLYRLYQQNELIDNFEWSSFINTDKIEKECKEIIRYYSSSIDSDEYNNKIFDVFVKDVNKSADDINIILGPEDHTFYSGFPYNAQMFSNTKYSVISESYFSTNRNGGNDDAFPFITEKTWKTIVNHHPFIMVGMPYTNRYLEDMGFKVFDKFMKYPKYQSMEDKNIYQDPYNRLEVIIENINNFNNNLDENRDIIAQYTKHNSNHFITLVEEEMTKIMAFISENNIKITINKFLSKINDTFDDKNEYHILNSK